MKPIFIVRTSFKIKNIVFGFVKLAALITIAWLLGRGFAFAVEAPFSMLDKTLGKIVTVNNSKHILLETMPILYPSADLEKDAVNSIIPNPKNLFLFLTNPNINGPGDYLGSELKLLKSTGDEAAAVSTGIYADTEEEYIPELQPESTSSELLSKENMKNLEKNGNPLVAIYTTHNAETYIPTDGTDKLEGQNAGISKVAATLAQALKNRQIETIRATVIHDYPSFPKSYNNSEKTFRTMLQGNSSLKVIIDVHRDAGVKKREVVKIDGQKVAKIMLIVGSNARLKHPNWQQNKKFAAEIVKKMNQMYPGLSKGYRVQSGRYNQHLHSHAILIEVGSAKNSLEEAERSVSLFADVLTAILAEMKN
ncbi:stage II sporulation protein P [Bacillota bacterium LX-D]|nr:stage II sporulation protein P [Bacillota bacterium LX-D]